MQDSLPGLALQFSVEASEAFGAFNAALKSLHVATVSAGRRQLAADAEYRLRLRRAIADMTAVLDATSTPVNGERSFDKMIMDLRELQPSQLKGPERARLLDAVAPLHEELANSVDFDATRVLLEATPAGPASAALVFDTDPDLLDPDAQVSYVQACERLANSAHARRDAGILAFTGANPVRTRYWVDGDEHALTDVRALELQTAMRWNAAFTHQRIDSARALNALPDTKAAYEKGLASARTVDAITDGSSALTGPIDQALAAAITGHAEEVAVDELRTLRSGLIAAFDTKVAAFATEHNPLNLPGKIRSTLVQLDPEGAAARRAIAVRAQANVEYRTLPDGLAQIIATMAAEQALACMRSVEAAAREAHSTDDSEPIGVRRVQAFTHLLTRRNRPRANTSAAVQLIAGAETDANAEAASTALDAPAPEQQQGKPCAPPEGKSGSAVGVHLDVVMDLHTFLGLTQTPADVVGAGPVPAHAARHLLADAAYVRIRRVLTDPVTGHRLDTGVKRYVLTALEQDLIFSRDQRCRFPDCRRRAIDCECDHALPYDRGGPSSTPNLGALCKLHHQHKTHAGWEISASNADGSCTWTSPLGRTYQHEHTPVLPWTIDTAPLPHDPAENSASQRNANGDTSSDPAEQPPF